MRNLNRAKGAPLAWIACVFTLGPVHAADEQHWLDVEGQIQYGYYTEDSRTLGELAARLDSHADADVLQGYYAALAYYRIALLSPASDRARGTSAAERCGANVDQSLRLRASWAEALALQGACSGLLAEFKALRAPLAAIHGRAQLARALELEPHNPRVLLLDGSLGLADAHAGAKPRACGEFAAAVAAFELARSREERAPEWGAPEGYAYRARCDLDRGDVSGARDALERALLIAPDFQVARRLLRRVTAG